MGGVCVCTYVREGVGKKPPNVCEEWLGDFKMSFLVTRIQEI